MMRHGEKENDFPESGLTTKGEKQIIEMSAFFKNKDHNISCIYGTSLTRSIETCKLLSEQLSIKMIIKKELGEFTREFFISKPSEDDKIYKINYIAFLSEIFKKNQDVLLGVHAGVIRFILSYLFNIPLDVVKTFRLDYGSLTIVSFNEIYRNWTLDGLNLKNENVKDRIDG